MAVALVSRSCFTEHLVGILDQKDFFGGEGYERTNGEDEKGSEESFCDGLSFRWKKEM